MTKTVASPMGNLSAFCPAATEAAVSTGFEEVEEEVGNPVSFLPVDV